MASQGKDQQDSSSRAFSALAELVQGGRPLIYVQSPEELRVHQLLTLAAARLFPSEIPVWTWSSTAGLRPPASGDAEASPLGARAVLDFIRQLP